MFAFSWQIVNTSNFQALFDECDYVNCELDCEIENDAIDAAGNSLEMIQTASIYSNGRPSCHTSQARGFQVIQSTTFLSDFAQVPLKQPWIHGKAGRIIVMVKEVK